MLKSEMHSEIERLDRQVSKLLQYENKYETLNLATKSLRAELLMKTAAFDDLAKIHKATTLNCDDLYKRINNIHAASDVLLAVFYPAVRVDIKLPPHDGKDSRFMFGQYVYRESFKV